MTSQDLMWLFGQRTSSKSCFLPPAQIIGFALQRIKWLGSANFKRFQSWSIQSKSNPGGCKMKWFCVYCYRLGGFPNSPWVASVSESASPLGNKWWMNSASSSSWFLIKSSILTNLSTSQVDASKRMQKLQMHTSDEVISICKASNRNEHEPKGLSNERAPEKKMNFDSQITSAWERDFLRF